MKKIIKKVVPKFLFNWYRNYRMRKGLQYYQGDIDHIETHNIFVLDGIEAWIDEKCKKPRFFHAVGDGRFIVDGEKINHRKIMIDKLPAGV